MACYSTRNSHYLRISKDTVLPVFLYLDERHVGWMSDKILQHVLSDLRPHILPKLKAEADNLFSTNTTQKRTSTVDTHRGDNYQFCYFLRKREPHSVVIKTRNFTLTPQVKKRSTIPVNAPQPSTKRGKRKEMDVNPSQATAAGRKRKKISRTITPPPGIGGDDDDSEMVVEGQEGPAVELEIEEEEKPKPILGLTYQGFNIYGHCLCLVVEPWPAIRSTAVRPILDPSQTPLFLPETGDDFNIERPAEAAQLNQPYLDRILNDRNVSDKEGDAGGMMDFSQVLNNIGDARPGAVNDDDDMDGSILFGDADEFKEL